MENASDALIMAGQMLIFIVALTVCISSFTTVRAEVNRIVGENEEIRMAKDGDTYLNYIESKKSSSTRVVGSEAVVTSMYRAIKEDYVIYIKFKNDTINQIGTNQYITKMNATVDSKIIKDGQPIIKVNDKLIKITIGSDTNQNINSVLRSTNGGGVSVFDIMREKKFNEYLGEYQKSSAEGVTSENKEVYRIITYVEV
jgi:hypothetical protein